MLYSKTSLRAGCINNDRGWRNNDHELGSSPSHGLTFAWDKKNLLLENFVEQQYEIKCHLVVEWERKRERESIQNQHISYA